ncbi:MAG: 16S rRNA (guanine(966)-N(2))-methyltransferase RsmD [Bacilli bacterium]|nr:16S rRNA (guanine(966)-N(2))-methyltransferase RsmD [Bacilli bacterium]
MRIISGKYKGRKLLGQNIEGTRPTMDRVKESLFGIIQNNIKDSICLDLFAGTGALGLEAISNGAKECYFIDKNIISINIIKENSKGIENVKIMNKDYLKALNELKNIKFDVIFLDPPYKMNLIQSSLNKIKENNMLNKNGIIVCEFEKEEFEIDYYIFKEKKYGNKNIRIYQNK